MATSRAHDPTAPVPEETDTSGLKGWLAFAGCCAIWGSTFLVIRIGNDTVPPLWAATLRLAFAVSFLTAILWITRAPFPRRKALIAAAQFGFLNFGVSFCLLYWGEKYAPSGLTAVIYGIIPLATALFARLFGLEKLNPLKIGASVVALAGVATIFSSELKAAVPPARLLAVIAAALCGSLSGVMLKRGPRQHPIGANAAGAMVGLVVCLTASLLAREPHPIPTTTASLLPILYLSTAGSIGAFGLFAWLINHWSVTRTSFIAVVVPVVALALGVLVRHERLRTSGLIGAGLVFAGLALGIAADRVKR